MMCSFFLGGDSQEGKDVCVFCWLEEDVFVLGVQISFVDVYDPFTK